MSIRAAIHHLTHYKYDRPVSLGPQIIRLRPAPHSRTRVISHSLKVTPADHFVNHQQDPYGNWLARYVFPELVNELKIEVDVVADMTVYNPFDFFVEESAEIWPFEYGEDLRPDLVIYRTPEPVGPELAAFLNRIDRTPKRTVDFVVDLNSRLSREIKYLIRMEPGVQSPEETFGRASGSCRDSSWLLVQILRNLGLAARFVSGYLIQLKPDLVALDGPPGTDHDFTDLHAWAEVYLPGAGWIGLDPTSGLLTGESHIPLAATPHYRNAAPISGLASFANVDFNFEMRVKRVAEHPRITKPYSEEAWKALDALGEEVDRKLVADDVRLTMGGEPTFVSIDDFESGEWNTDAVGPTKRALADRLVRRLRDRFAPGGFLHYGQGKWYPGESLPRWTFSLYWRRDGKPIWQNPKSIAVEGVETGATSEKAQTLLGAIASELGVASDYVAPAYEDPAEWIVKEANLPPNVSPENSKLKDPEERHRIARVFSRGLTEPSGYVLPVQRWQAKADAHRWRSEKWKTRRGALHLVPGDSPVGYRLPLGALPYVPPASFPYIVEADPTEPRGPLPDFHDSRERAQRVASFAAAEAGQQERVEQRLGDIDGAVRTAVTVEARDGHLCVFLPPVERLEDYLELVAAAEAAAEQVGAAGADRGLSAPGRSAHERHSRRAGSRRDRGQHPSLVELARMRRHDRGDLRRSAARAPRRRQIHDRRQAFRHRRRQSCRRRRGDAARQSVPQASGPLEKPRHPLAQASEPQLFLLRPVHRSDQPGAARRRSAPRQPLRTGDRARPDPAARKGPDPAAVAARSPDAQSSHRRHRQHPSGGNLRRQALFARRPDRPSRPHRVPRLRDAARPAHEPRPAIAHPRDPLAALARSARRSRCRAGDRRCTTGSCCRTSSGRICSTCSPISRRMGCAFRSDWYEAQAEFRFPFCGEVEYEGVKLELRQALEPWHVLGETGAIGGTARYTNSSTERLQVKLTTSDPDRYVVACNRRRVPLRGTATGGVAVGAVRYKAWKPAMAMHPTVPVQAPLVLDIFDAWNGRALGGCVYHVAHPGGRSYDTFPVNSNEAEARRLARFEARGHTPGAYEPPPETPHPEFPLTLDLRRPAGV